MVKGEKPYDQAAVDAALAQLEDTAKKLPTLFPESIKGLKPEGDYSSSPKIWEDKAGFDAKIASFAKVVAEAKAKIKDLDSAEGGTCLPSARSAAAATRHSASRRADRIQLGMIFSEPIRIRIMLWLKGRTPRSVRPFVLALSVLFTVFELAYFVTKFAW